jgi:hypothetical protein
MDAVINRTFREALQDFEVVLGALVYPPGILVFCPGSVVDLELQDADYGEDLLQSMDF